MELKNVAILGSRGNVGAAIILELLKHPGITITAITRPTSKYVAPHPRVVIKTADYDNLASLTEAFEGPDAIVNCVSGSATQFGPSELIINAALASSSVKLFFANEFVGNVESPQFIRMPEVAAGSKVRIRKLLGELSQQGKLTWTSLNGGPFFDMWVMKGPAGFDVKNRKARVYGTGENKLFWTPLSVIAQATVAMLLNPAPVLNRPVHIAPIKNLTQNAILHALEDSLGKFEVEHVDVEKINKHAKIALERGEFGKAMKGFTISNQFFEGDSGNDLSELLENELVSVEEMDVAQAVQLALKHWGTEGDVVQGMFMVEACDI